MKHVSFRGRLVMLGCGSIGQGVLPLILRHIDMPKDRITIVTADARGRDVAAECGVRFVEQPATRDNLRDLLVPLLGRGDFLLNLSIDVSSVALIELCQEIGALYLDTCIEPWPGGYTDPSLTPSQRSNYGLRESALAVARRYPDGPTAVLTHGANPGLVSHLMKEALLHIARDTGLRRRRAVRPGRLGGACREAGHQGRPHRRARHPGRASTAPRRSASSSTPGPSTASWARAASRPSSAGARTRRRFPADGHRHEFGCDAAIYLLRPGAGTRVRSWTPLEGPMHAFLVTHNEFDLDRRLLHGARRERRRALPADRPLRLPPLRRRRALRP